MRPACARQVCILRRMDHPGIIALKDVFLRPASSGARAALGAGAGLAHQSWELAPGTGDWGLGLGCFGWGGWGIGGNHRSRAPELSGRRLSWPAMPVTLCPTPAGAFVYRKGQLVPTSLDLYLALEFCDQVGHG